MSRNNASIIQANKALENNSGAASEPIKNIIKYLKPLFRQTIMDEYSIDINTPIKSNEIY